MTWRIRNGALLTLLMIGAGLALDARPARAQGAPNTYEDFPFNQGSLFYRPLKPKPRPKVTAAPRPVYTAPAQGGGYTYVQPGSAQPAPANGFTARSYGYYAPQPRYYYPTAPRYAQPYQAAPAARVAPAAPVAAPAAPVAAPAAPVAPVVPR